VAETLALVDVLKRALRRSGVTYAHIAKALGLSESSVKRLFATRNLSLKRLDQICELSGMEISDLLALLEERSQRVDELTEGIEAELVGDPMLLLVAYCLLNYWTFEQIVSTYELSETQCIKLLVQLDRMKIIELLPGNRVRLLVSRRFKWRSDGPIEKFFRSQVQHKFFDSDFRQPGECRLVLNGRLSSSSNAMMLGRMRRLAEAFEEANTDDRRLPLDQRSGTTMVLAIRPWQLDVFERFTRKGQ